MELTPLSIIVPVYNEAGGLPPTVKRLRKVLASLPEGSEVILVNDGSTDGSAEVLRDIAGDGLRVVNHPRNRGYGAALKTGARVAQCELLAICDADGTYPVEKIPGMAERLLGEQAAMVVAHRPKEQQPLVRRPAKAVLRWLAEYLTGERIPDLNSGLRVFRKESVRRYVRLLPDGFSFTTTITMALLTEGQPVLYEPIRYRGRIGSSKIKPIRDTANFLLLILRTTLAFHPMKVFGPAALLLMGAGGILLILRLLLDNAFGIATTIVLLVGGVQVLALGLLADLINRRGSGE